MREIVSRIKILAKLDISERRRPQDGSFRFAIERAGVKSAVDLRVSMIPSYSGESVVIRILDRTGAPTGLADLKLDQKMTDGIAQRPGTHRRHLPGDRARPDRASRPRCTRACRT